MAGEGGGTSSRTAEGAIHHNPRLAEFTRLLLGHYPEMTEWV